MKGYWGLLGTGGYWVHTGGYWGHALLATAQGLLGTRTFGNCAWQLGQLKVTGCKLLGTRMFSRWAEWNLCAGTCW